MTLAKARTWVRYKTDVVGRISTWPRFAREVRAGNNALLRRLPDFSNPILVAGCQRSGTTAVSRLLTNSEGLTKFWSRHDEELDAALILSGIEAVNEQHRYCFQTTYLNERYVEYLNYVGQFKLVWLLRNPYSVIHSILHNWDRFAFNELYAACGQNWLAGNKQSIQTLQATEVEKACASYNAKVSQMYELYQQLGDENMLVLDYDKLVGQKQNVLPELYQFVGLEYRGEYSERIHAGSVEKANGLNTAERATVERLSEAEYLAAAAKFALID